MGKSSLGKRKTSIMPVRLLSLGEQQEQAGGDSNQRGRSVKKKSFIPRPTHSRSSSVEMAVVCQPLAVGSAKRSRSQNNVQSMPLCTPIVTPCINLGIPGTGQFSRGGYTGDSKMSSRSSRAIPKDKRVLADKHFQNLAVHRIQAYLSEEMSDKELAVQISRALTTRSLTLKLFVDFVAHLLQVFFKRSVINMSNYEDEIPHLCKKISYPSSVKKSWLKTANSIHSWPNVVGLLSWLVVAAQFRKSQKLEDLFPPQDSYNYDEEDDLEKIKNPKRMFFHYLKCHDLFNKEKSHELSFAEEEICRDFKQELNVEDSDFETLKETIERLQAQLEDPREVALAQAAREFVAGTLRLGEEVQRLKDSNQNKKSVLKKLEADTKMVRATVDETSNNIVKRRLDSEKVSQQIECQTMSVDNERQVAQEMQELKESLRTKEINTATLSKTVYSDDLEIANLKDKLNKLRVEYDTTSVEHCNVIPELNTLMVPENTLQTDEYNELVQRMESLRQQEMAAQSRVEQQLEEEEEEEEVIPEMAELVKAHDRALHDMEQVRIELQNFKDMMKQTRTLHDTQLLNKQKEKENYMVESLHLGEDTSKLEELEANIVALKAHIAKEKERAADYFAEDDKDFKKQADLVMTAVRRLLDVKPTTKK